MRVVLDGEVQVRASVVALGMFDGVHIGHRVLLRRARALARQQGVPLVACTFAEHPLQVIRPDKAPLMLTTLDERAHIMEGLGVDVLWALPFDRALMNTSPEEYMAQLCRQLHPLFVVAGYNYTFGRKGEGDIHLLSALGEVFGYSTQVVPQITLEGQEVSASIIRRLLGEGRVRQARQMLGAPYRQAATVAERLGNGYRLHMPPQGKQTVPKGSYRVSVENGQRAVPATFVATGPGEGRAALPPLYTRGDEVFLRYYSETSGGRR